MKTVQLITLVLVTVLFFATATTAWTKEDHEIFRLRDEVHTYDGENTTFYNLIGVKSSATTTDMTQAYRKRSKRIHPDKAIPSMIAEKQAAKVKTDTKKGGVRVQKGPSSKERAQISKEANENYARFRNVYGVLQNPQTRERYDHFLANGFPRWRGTGYYYERFRPGLVSVLIGLMIVVGGGVHYGALYIGWKRQKEFVERYVKEARRMAWGNEGGVPGIPGAANGTPTGVELAEVPPQPLDSDPGMVLNRRQKRMQEKESKRKDTVKPVRTARKQGISSPVEAEPISGPQGSKKKVIAQNGKVLIVDGVGNVFLEEQTAEGETQEFLLDPDELEPPTIFQTALFRVPIWAYAQTVGRGIDFVKGTNTYRDQDLLVQDMKIELNPEEKGTDLLEAATAANANGELKKRQTKVKGRKTDAQIN